MVDTESPSTNGGEREGGCANHPDQLPPPIFDKHALPNVYQQRGAQHLECDEDADQRCRCAGHEQNAAEQFDRSGEHCGRRSGRNPHAAEPLDGRGDAVRDELLPAMGDEDNTKDQPSEQ
jgi:hypothetical protein